MKQVDVDLAIIGGGPAGLAAAIEARKRGVKRVVIIERDKELGGILQQCIHDGFGILRFGKRLSGCGYAQRFIDEAAEYGITVALKTMVIEITAQRELYAVSEAEGMRRFNCGAVILAMGCRERTRAQALIYGTRPKGVMTAGSVQRYINIEGYLPGRRAVILGSGDIGLIMARRMSLEGIEVVGVYELMESPGGLTRNIVQCLHDYDIPLHLSTTVVRIHGNDSLEGVTVARVDGQRRVMEETREYIPCDLLVLAVGLIPENELSSQMGIGLDPRTKGPVVDNFFATDAPGVFAAGNVATVFDLVDYVSVTGEQAAAGAKLFLDGRFTDGGYVEVSAGENVDMAVPQRIRKDVDISEVSIYLRVKRNRRNVRVEVRSGEQLLYSRKHVCCLTAEMLVAEVSYAGLNELDGITVDVVEVG